MLTDSDTARQLFKITMGPACKSCGSHKMKKVKKRPDWMTIREWHDWQEYRRQDYTIYACHNCGLHQGVKEDEENKEG